MIFLAGTVVSSFLATDASFTAVTFGPALFLALDCFCSATGAVVVSLPVVGAALAGAGGLNLSREELGGLGSPGGFRRPVLFFDSCL